jgi:high-affinity iron transporter
MRQFALLGSALLFLAAAGRAGELTGIVVMPAGCSPAVSPAVVRLESLDGSKPAEAPGTSEVLLTVQQKYLQFQPRVSALRAGETLRFTNGDNEAHNVHIVGPGVNFNRTIGPRETAELAPRRGGILRLLCDIHIHMRGYVVVSETPWIAVCDRTGAFRIADVPAGKYRLAAWHELGDPLLREVEVGESGTDAGTLALQGPELIERAVVRAEPVAWPEVIDRISVTCAAALDVASRERAAGATKAVGLIDDSYLGIFESSDMETAIRSALGYDRVIAVEEMFRKLRREVRGVAEGAVTPAAMSGSIRALLSALVRDARDLQSKGINDRSGVLRSQTAVAADRGGPGLAEADGDDPRSRLADLRRALDRVSDLAERGDPAEAAAEVVTAYFDAFEPIERLLYLRNPGAIQPLEARFATLRGEVGTGLRGEALDQRLSAIHQDTAQALATASDTRASVFGLAFAASLGTILREGVEVILLLTMLLALIAKAGRPRGATAALWWGVGLAAAASAATAVGLNLVIASTRGRSREIVEGVVMLAASGVLFYVSYWLISQSETQRWLAFIKEKAGRGASLGSFFMIGLAAFLAVYREGAETVLMYQALVAGQPREGIAGIAAGTAVGVALLVVIALLLRVTSLRIPLKPFFQITGLVLFALAVVFAGNGVLELQVAGVLKSTPMPAIGRGVPLLGVHPTVQGAAVQGLLLCGALIARVYLGLQRGAQVAGKGQAASSRSLAAEASAEAAVSVGP